MGEQRGGPNPDVGPRGLLSRGFVGSRGFERTRAGASVRGTGGLLRGGPSSPTVLPASLWGKRLRKFLPGNGRGAGPRGSARPVSWCVRVFWSELDLGSSQSCGGLLVLCEHSLPTATGADCMSTSSATQWVSVSQSESVRASQSQPVSVSQSLAVKVSITWCLLVSQCLLLRVWAATGAHPGISGAEGPLAGGCACLSLWRGPHRRQ